MAQRLNLGCGDKKREGYTNVDLCGDPDLTCDLNVFPWPFADNSVDEVFSEHFLEHVMDYEKTVWEMHRILKPGGLLHFKVPHFKRSDLQAPALPTGKRNPPVRFHRSRRAEEPGTCPWRK